MGIFFIIFRHLTELCVSFSGAFHYFRNYGPAFHSIYGIMTLKSRVLPINGPGPMALWHGPIVLSTLLQINHEFDDVFD